MMKHLRNGLVGALLFLSAALVCVGGAVPMLTLKSPSSH